MFGTDNTLTDEIKNRMIGILIASGDFENFRKLKSIEVDTYAIVYVMDMIPKLTHFINGIDKKTRNNKTKINIIRSWLLDIHKCINCSCFNLDEFKEKYPELII